MSDAAQETRKLARNSALYLIPNLLVRGLSFLLTPVYARFMTPADFGVLGVCTTVSTLTALLVSFSLPSVIARLHFDMESEQMRRRFYGTILLFMLTGAPLLVGAAHLLGALEVVRPMRQVPFSPHLTLAMWTGYLTLLVTVPGVLLTAREEAGRVAAYNVFAAVAQIGLTVAFVVWMKQGALGAVRAQFLAAGVSALVGLALYVPHMAVAFDLGLLKRALLLGLPMVLHVSSNWILNLADRMILERYAPASDVGLYTLAYLFTMAALLVLNSIGDAFGPITLRLMKADPASPTVPLLGTMTLGLDCYACLGAAVLGEDAVRLFFPASYAGAVPMISWVVAGAAMQGVYHVWSQGSWYRMNTRGIAAATTFAAITNLTLNFIFVPRYGAMAAAVLTFVTYLELALLHGVVATASYRIAWRYRDWLMCLGAMAAVYAGCAAVARALPPVAAASLRLGIVVLGFPLALWALGVVRREHVARFLAARRGA
ncbi:MAG: oligosaccharide flippase family protein [Polyangiaceae bacterium]|nr:oligosaccharide flippase family protein [Polyangiaceae bacterium]